MILQKKFKGIIQANYKQTFIFNHLRGGEKNIIKENLYDFLSATEYFLIRLVHDFSRTAKYEH